MIHNKSANVKLIFLVLLLYAVEGLSKKLYKYQDSQGNWHYTDKKPIEGQKFESRQLKAEPKKHVWLEKTGDKRKPEYILRNTYFGPVELEVRFIDQENVFSTPQLPNRFVVEQGKSPTLFQVTGINKYKSWKYSLSYRYTLGNPASEHQPDTVYIPPIASDGQFPISQS